MNQSMLVTSSLDGGLVSQSTQRSTIWFGRTYPCDLAQDSLPPHYIIITTFMNFITISLKASSTGTPTVMITATNISGYQAPCRLTFISCLLGTPIDLICGIITTGTSLSKSIISFVNDATDRWSAPCFNNTDCAAKGTSVDEFSASLSLHNSVDLFYCDSIL